MPAIADTPFERADATPGPTEPLFDDDWAAWIVGTWAGVVESPSGNGTQLQTFEFAVDGRYVLTRLHREIKGGPTYKGIGIFMYRERGAYAMWAGAFNDVNDGTAIRDGEAMSWTIERFGHTVTRVRQRLSENEFVVTSRWTNENGEKLESHERMSRVHN